MPNNILLIDAGNSAIKWGLSSLDGIPGMKSTPYIKDVTASFFIEQWQNIIFPTSVVVSCVASENVLQSISEACDKLWSIKVQIVSSQKEGFGLINAYDDASTLGSDRWSAMIGALQLTDTSFIVIDAGSALTVDMVDEAGNHLGGYIIPGLSMMKKSLGVETALIETKSAKSTIPILSLGHSTADCIEAGIALSAICLIEAVYKREFEQASHIKCFITGGDAQLIASLLKFQCEVVPELVLNGLAVIAANSSK